MVILTSSLAMMYLGETVKMLQMSISIGGIGLILVYLISYAESLILRNVCWDKFKQDLKKHLNDQGRSPIDFSSAKDVRSVYLAVGEEVARKVLVYWYIEKNGNNRKNHISMIMSPEMCGGSLYDAAADFNVARSKFWALNLPNAYDISDALLVNFGLNTVSSGRAPMEMKALLTARLALWNQHKGSFGLFRCNSTNMVLPKSMNSVVVVPDTEATLADYIQGVNHDLISFAFSVVLHLFATPTWNDNSYYHRALGCPQVGGENVYFSYPASATRAAVLAGMFPYGKKIIDKSRAAADTKCLGTVVNMFKSWGWDVLKTFTITDDAGNQNATFCYADFLVPTWPGLAANHSNALMAAVRADHNVIIAAMTNHRKAQSGSPTKTAMPEGNVDYTKFKFFAKGADPKMNI
jgi:hypothetical protein